MKKIAVNMQSRIYAESILLMLGQTGNFRPCRIPGHSAEEILIECMAEKPEILLMDVVPTPVEMSLEKRLLVAGAMRRELPGCRIAILCDETAYPELAREVMRAKQESEHLGEQWQINGRSFSTVMRSKGYPCCKRTKENIRRFFQQKGE